MTFAASPGVVMVSDRRLTWPDGSFADDDSNKIVMFCNQMAFAYTGQAMLEGKSTDEWLARELAGLPDRSLSAACEHIRLRATELFRRPPLQGKCQAFVGVGFTPKTETSSVRPIRVDISNMYERGQMLDKPRDEFAWTWEVCEGQDWRVGYTGVTTTQSERTWITRRIGSMAPKGVGATPIIESFRDFIRMVSDRFNNQWVGKSLLAVSIPKASAQSEDVGIFGPGGHGAVLMSKETSAALRAGGNPPSLSGLLDGPRPEFHSIPEGKDNLVHVGPRLACPGLGHLSSVTVEFGRQSSGGPA